MIETALMHMEGVVAGAGIWAPIVYVLVMVVAIIISPIPSSPLIIFAGTLFGVWEGVLWSLLGAFLGALIAFFIARIFGRPVILKFISKEKLRKTKEKFPEGHIALSVFLLRLLPLPFFDAVSYAAGLTHITLRKFSFATFFGLIPLIVVFSFFGDALSPKALFYVVVGVIPLSIISFFVVTRGR